ncbi:uncharacterized protein UTRI_01675 [Ustilago trichophora]|uniref:Uncharacterized protein n=1 Tax=Ustilago trichophora TaxID=86804 RepID=A0A5C3E0D2_9BASI|nr:uncharacterized protein UTRI_01675 [Ustilago trichophora]
MFLHHVKFDRRPSLGGCILQKGLFAEDQVSSDWISLISARFANEEGKKNNNKKFRTLSFIKVLQSKSAVSPDQCLSKYSPTQARKAAAAAVVVATLAIRAREEHVEED